MNAPILPRPGTSRLAPCSLLRAPRSAFTLVEMLISLAITLVMMAAVVNLFANIGAGVKIRRATMEMSGELRMMRAVLFNDLAGATCRALPWQRPDEGPGYIEIVEGQYEDIFPTGLTLDLRTSQVPGSQIPNPNGITDRSGLGDYDDILTLTVRNENTPFKGRADGTTIESNLAEVIWYAVENPEDGSLGEPGMRTVYRRVLLIAPWYEIPPTAPTVPMDFFHAYDISARYDAALARWVPNTLGDLTKRENRYAHFFDPALPDRGFPHHFPHDGAGNLVQAAGPGTSLVPLTGDRVGEDLVLSNVLAFDLRVFDPGAPLYMYDGVIVEPLGTNDYAPAGGNYFTQVLGGVLSGFGAYVDLGWDDSGEYSRPSGAPPTQFQAARRVGWHPRTPVGGTPSVYDTWSFHYEHDGIDQDAATDNGAGIDQGTNGLDDDVGAGAVNGVDDILERETSPPYPVPLRGMQVKLRIYEPDTRQIREATVTRNFVE